MNFIEINSEEYLSAEDLPNEIWKDVEGYDNDYKVSNYGRVKSVGNNPILKVWGSLQGCVKLIKNTKPVQVPIQYLVAFAFLDYDGKSVIKHKDGDSFNNSVDNLEII